MRDMLAFAPFQLKYISNHKTWVVAVLVAAAVLQFHVQHDHLILDFFTI
jgi:hypothetical protein